MLTIKSEPKMLTAKSIYVIHNDLRGYTSPVNIVTKLNKMFPNKAREKGF